MHRSRIEYFYHTHTNKRPVKLHQWIRYLQGSSKSSTWWNTHKQAFLFYKSLCICQNFLRRDNHNIITNFNTGIFWYKPWANTLNFVWTLASTFQIEWYMPIIRNIRINEKGKKEKKNIFNKWLVCPSLHLKSWVSACNLFPCNLHGDLQNFDDELQVRTLVQYVELMNTPMCIEMNGHVEITHARWNTK